MRKNVIVVFGGMSSENEISVITGTMVSNLVDEEKYGVYPEKVGRDRKSTRLNSSHRL